MGSRQFARCTCSQVVVIHKRNSGPSVEKSGPKPPADSPILETLTMKIGDLLFLSIRQENESLKLEVAMKNEAGKQCKQLNP